MYRIYEFRDSPYATATEQVNKLMIDNETASIIGYQVVNTGRLDDHYKPLMVSHILVKVEVDHG